MKTNIINNNESANQVKNNEQARKQPQAVTDKDGRHCYAFVLYVGGEISRILAAGWWSTYNDAETTTSGMAVAAVAFKKTAAVVAYELQDNDVYELMTTRNVGSRDRLCFKIHRSRIEAGKYIAPTQEEQKEYFSMGNSDIYAGAECMPVGWNEPKHAARLEEGARVLCIHYGIFGTIDHHNTCDGKITYVVKYDEPQRRADGSTFQFEEYDREGITTNYDPTTGKEIEGNAQHYREVLCASWWGGDDVPRLFEFCGQKLVCICKGEYWDLTTDDGKGTQHDLTLDELADVLAQYYADEQKAQAGRVA